MRPLITIVSAILLILNLYGDGEWTWDRGFLYATIFNNLGVTVSLYFLVLFYQISAKELRPYKPLLKFSVIKGIVFFCYWQSVFIAILISLAWFPTFRDWDEARRGVVLQNILICIEMLGFSILHLFAFPYEIYQVKTMSQAPLVQQYELSRGIKRSVKDAISQKDFAKDTLDAFVPRKKKKENTTPQDEGVVPLEPPLGPTESFGDWPVDLLFRNPDDNSGSDTSSVSQEELNIEADNTKLKKTARR